MGHLAIFTKIERILNYNFKNHKIYSICTQNTFKKSTRKIKRKTDAMFKPVTYRYM